VLCRRTGIFARIAPPFHHARPARRAGLRQVRHSASLRSVWYRLTVRLYCFEWLASTRRIHGRFEKRLGITADAIT
jgi:hypothetical protein